MRDHLRRGTSARSRPGWGREAGSQWPPSSKAAAPALPCTKLTILADAVGSKKHCAVRGERDEAAPQRELSGSRKCEPPGKSEPLAATGPAVAGCTCVPCRSLCRNRRHGRAYNFPAQEALLRPHKTNTKRPATTSRNARRQASSKQTTVSLFTPLFLSRRQLFSVRLLAQFTGKRGERVALLPAPLDWRAIRALLGALQRACVNRYKQRIVSECSPNFCNRGYGLGRSRQQAKALPVLPLSVRE